MSKRSNNKLKWTDQMNKDLLLCKRRALELIKSENPPRKDDGKKKGYIEVMKQLWEERGYFNLGLKAQNLRDQASRLEKLQESSTNQRDQENADISDNTPVSQEIESGFEINEVEYATNQPRPSMNLHSTTSRVPEDLKDKDSNGKTEIRPNLPDFNVLPSHLTEKPWGISTTGAFCQEVNRIYDEMVHFKRNIFKVPSGRAGKDFVMELVSWLRHFNNNTDMNSIALKAFMVLPTLILQKPSPTSKAKDHSAAIERRLKLWKQGELTMLMKEIKFIQNKFNSSRKEKSMQDISKVFARLVMKGNLSAAIKLLDKETSSGVLNLSPAVLAELEKQHPPAAGIKEESLLHGPLDLIPPGIFDLIDERMIYKAAMRTRGSAGPSGMDAELYQRILCSKNFNTEGKILREEIATMTRNLLTFSYHPSLLESYV